MLVYCSINAVTGKKYIGCTTKTLKERQRNHKHDAFVKQKQHLFHKSIRKHGWDVFVWEIICECDTKEEMYDMETRLISEMNTLVPNGYNLTGGHDNTTLGYKFTDEQKERYRELRKNMTNPPNKGNKWSEEQRKIASERMKQMDYMRGDNNHAKRPESREKIRLRALGSGNSQSKVFRLTYPDGSSIIINGGIKRELEKLGLSYNTLCSYKRTKSGHLLEVLGKCSELKESIHLLQ